MMQALYFFGGLALLVGGADLLVRGASRLAITFGISPLVVGLTVVAFGTSAPELAVSVSAVLSGNSELALGNAVGSNTFNVLVVLGLSALVSPLAVSLQVLRQEVPLMIGAGVLLLLLCLDGSIGGLDSTLLVALLLAYTAFLVRQSRADPAAVADDLPPAAPWLRTRWMQALAVGVGLVLLVVGSNAMVGAAVVVARALGVSDVVIGLTIVAAGTSLPELATSVRAVMNGERDIAVGNVVGSCLFNVLGVVGVAGLAAAVSHVGSLAVPSAVLHFDLWVMLAALLACLPVFLTGREIARWEGALFLGYYLAYTAYLVMQSKHHDALPEYSFVMLGFVIPLTVLTLAVSVWRRSPLRTAG
ncbi:MAG: calcium/sodium antiporter [Rubrivivax sp.]